MQSLAEFLDLLVNHTVSSCSIHVQTNCSCQNRVLSILNRADPIVEMTAVVCISFHSYNAVNIMETKSQTFLSSPKDIPVTAALFPLEKIQIVFVCSFCIYTEWLNSATCCSNVEEFEPLHGNACPRSFC